MNFNLDAKASVSKKGSSMPKKRFYDQAMAKKDGGMISSEGFSGLPQNFIMKPYPRDNSYLPENLNDGLSGIDQQISEDKRGIKLSNSKF